MTWYEPQLTLERLVVTKGAVRVYDQRFHSGVNIIRGMNGSGKSTIADFIFFALGGDLSQWHHEMKLCDYTFAEVLINGRSLTLRRDVSGGATRRPMAIFWGGLDSAVSSAITEWEVYPFNSTPTKQSFSQALFRALGIPEVKGELASRITMHQILRLMYVDQFTPFNSIFRDDSFDSILIREAVGNLLCGVYDHRLYEAQLELARKRAEYDVIESKLSSIFAVLGRSDESFDAAKLTGDLQERRAERLSLYARLADNSLPMEEANQQSQKRTREIRQQLTGIRKAVRFSRG